MQVEGVQFMYDNLVVNTEQLRDGGEGAKGNGCILAHCMGLGKTLQVGGIPVLYSVFFLKHAFFFTQQNSLETKLKSFKKR